MHIKRKLAFVILTTAALIVGTASAAQTTTTTVLRVRPHAEAGSNRLDIMFAANVTTSCTNNNWISIDGYATDETREQLSQIATVARLGGFEVEVYAYSGSSSYCVNGMGKMVWMSLREK